MFDCDCSLYELREFLVANRAHAPISLLSGSKFTHSLLLSDSNFQTWKCKVNPMLMKNHTESRFMLLNDSKSFICPDPNLPCPEQCTCYRGANDSRMLVDCHNRSLTKFPKNIKLPEHKNELVVSLEYNSIAELSDCESSSYRWLQNVTQLNLQHNGLTPKKMHLFGRFLRCMDKISHLFLAYNNIDRLPHVIQHKSFKALSIASNKLTCCISERWIKSWLQDNSKIIFDSVEVYCQHKGRSTIAMLMVCNRGVEYLESGKVLSRKDSQSETVVLFYWLFSCWLSTCNI